MRSSVIISCNQIQVPFRFLSSALISCHCNFAGRNPAAAYWGAAGRDFDPWGFHSLSGWNCFIFRSCNLGLIFWGFFPPLAQNGLFPMPGIDWMGFRVGSSMFLLVRVLSPLRWLHSVLENQKRGDGLSLIRPACSDFFFSFPTAPPVRPSTNCLACCSLCLFMYLS